VAVAAVNSVVLYCLSERGIGIGCRAYFFPVWIGACVFLEFPLFVLDVGDGGFRFSFFILTVFRFADYISILKNSPCWLMRGRR
jgi:hypothetical protein